MPNDPPQNSDEQAGLVADLSRPEAYSHEVDRVARVETHTSNVFLAGDLAYKVKKPVDFGFCDFSTREKRRHFTVLEMDLNQALSSGVYLGISKVRVDSAGRHSMDGQGETAEVALRMRRLSERDALAALVADDAVSAATVQAISRKIAGFHGRAAAPRPARHFGSLPTIRTTVMSNQDRAEEFASEFVDGAAMANVRGFADAWLLRRGKLIDARHLAGLPRECHGDLHAGNIFLEGDQNGGLEIQIIDCIEFNDTLRTIDPAADVAFLSMDLRRLGRADLAENFLDAYFEASGDHTASELIPFYSSYRAMVRCMANGLNAQSAKGDSRAHAVKAARNYLRLACDLASTELPEKLAVIMAGPTGTGKSTVAKLLAGAWGLELLQTDVIRKGLAGLSPTARTQDGVRRGLYSRRMSQKTYAEMERRAVHSLREGRGAVLDGTYMGRHFRRRAVEALRQAGASVLIVECTLADEPLLGRLTSRYASGTSESEGRPEVYAMQKPQWERVQDDEADAVARINTGLQSGSLAQHTFREVWGAALRAAERVRPGT